MATSKTLDPLYEAYVWRGMRRDIDDKLNVCSVCHVHQRWPDHVPMGEMLLATYSMQIVGTDLIGPFVSSPSRNKCFTIIAHCTGWAEAFPLNDRSNASV